MKLENVRAEHLGTATRVVIDKDSTTIVGGGAEADRCSGDERTGALVLCRALQVPARQIAENSGADGGVIVDRVRSGAEGLGFDARSGETSDMFQVGIIDPTKVVRVALEHAVSVATTLLLAEATMTEIDDSPDEATTHEPLE